MANRTPATQGDIPKRRAREIVSVLRQAANKLRNGDVQDKFDATDLVLKSIRMLEGRE